MGFTEFYWILKKARNSVKTCLDPEKENQNIDTGFYWVLLSYTKLKKSSKLGKYLLRPKKGESEYRYWVLLGFTEFYWVLTQSQPCPVEKYRRF